MFGAQGCDGDVLVGEFDADAPAIDGSGGTSSSTTDTSSTGSAGSSGCHETQCQGRTYQCGDCEDNDHDGFIDSEDPDCLGPCHNSESTFFGSIPGQSGGNCGRDCYFDQDSGSGNDDCQWDHRCDLNEPDPERCPYDPNATVGSPPMSCDEAAASASDQCLSACLPLVPNGCDCFGCCEIPGALTPVWLGSEVNGQPSCSRGTLADPESCRPCEIVESCFNRCDECELCVGKTVLPSSCEGGGDEPPQICPGTAEACGLVGQSACAQDYYCITGCCILTIK